MLSLLLVFIFVSALIRSPLLVYITGTYINVDCDKPLPQPQNRDLCFRSRLLVSGGVGSSYEDMW